ncbi:cupredoxin domain-containing protein [Paraburkholderia phymatum]|uniref:Cytochrome c oxidase subunit II n=1 Tax=Paraburkholderia phymatum (strain DSM 17167 / CIP 108236 / LMG 21445 / STM815) TaxID=391038 RepID=B2JK77_PARP8|nr:cupredoxin domain-containing protein [Paraburkholderia phymatum]ACC70800.1 cytochrome c oxidase subunit II [Paraburkholderia phymatum STM815]
MQASAIDRKRRRLFTLAALGAVLTVAGRFDARAAEPRVIKVHARKFTFTPNQIKLAPNENVVFELTAQDTIMGFAIPQYNVRADVPPGAVVRLPAQAGAAGTVDFLCDIFCGSGHETMNGTIVVG